MNDQERYNVILKIIDVLRTFHSIKVTKYDFKEYIKNEINSLLKECQLDDILFQKLLNICDIYFKENKFGIIHNDIHFDNFIYYNGEVKLIDFERYMTGSIDYDFKRLSRYNEQPYLWASGDTDMLTVESDYQDMMDIFLENYDELNSIPYIRERLEVYSIIELLYQYRNTKKVELLESAKEKIKKILKKDRSD